MIDLAALPEWADVAKAVLSVWLVVALAVGLVTGAMAGRRDEQAQPKDDRRI